MFGFGAGIKIGVTEVRGGVYGNPKSKSFAIDRVITIGSSTGNKVVVNGTEELHCALYSIDGKLYLENTSTKAILMADRRRQGNPKDVVLSLKRREVKQGEIFFLNGVVEIRINSFNPA